MSGLVDLVNTDIVFALETSRREVARDKFYLVFRELSDQRGLSANPHPTLSRAERILENGLLPALNKKDTVAAQQVAQIPASTIVLAAYAAAGQEHTSWLGRDSRALRTFDQLRDTRFEHQQLNTIGKKSAEASGLLDHVATHEWVGHVRRQLTFKLEDMQLKG